MSSKIRSINVSAVAIACSLLLAVALVYGISVYQLFTVSHDDHSWLSSWWQVISDSYIRHVIGFSFFQAFVSATISIILGLITAHALFYQDFIGKNWVIKLLSLSMVLPVLVAVFGLLAVYGQSGWLAGAFNYLGLDWRPNIYGLTGIVLAHVFFNLPLSAKVFLTTLQSIPNQQRKLAAQLGIVDWKFIRVVELPYLLQQLPSLFILIFMLCFTSFSVVLIMGGSPKYTTLEVAIYQALVFNFELQRGAIIALLQCGFCLILFAMSSYVSLPIAGSGQIKRPYRTALNSYWQLWQRWVIGVLLLFVGLPLLSVVINSLDWQAWQSVLAHPQLYKALGFSLAIASSVGVLSVLMAVCLLIGARQLHFVGWIQSANGIVNMGMVVLAIPTLVLSVGLFLLLQSWNIGTGGLCIIVIGCNTLMAMPFALRILSEPLYNTMQCYDRLCQSLGLTGWARWRLIEWHALRQPMRTALALAMTLSLGDFTAIALFGNSDFTSLPHLLYQQLGSYRSDEASVTAFILLSLCALLFAVMEMGNRTASK